MAPENPFTPAFGEVPLYMAGRKVLLDSFVRAFGRQERAPELTTLVSGARGTGKTALLTRIAEEARARLLSHRLPAALRCIPKGTLLDI